MGENSVQKEGATCIRSLRTNEENDLPNGGSSKQYGEAASFVASSKKVRRLLKIVSMSFLQ